MKFKAVDARRVELASTILNGMIASAPLADRMKVDHKHWARIALAWADDLLDAALEDPDTMRTLAQAQKQRGGTTR